MLLYAQYRNEAENIQDFLNEVKRIMVEGGRIAVIEWQNEEPRVSFRAQVIKHMWRE